MSIEEQLKATDDVEVNLIRQVAYIQRQNPNFSDGVMINAMARVIGRTLAVASDDQAAREAVLASVDNIALSAMEQELERQKDGQ